MRERCRGTLHNQRRAWGTAPTHDNSNSALEYNYAGFRSFSLTQSTSDLVPLEVFSMVPHYRPAGKEEKGNQDRRGLFNC